MSFIGKNIRKIRAVKKLSQADFAVLFNLARPSVGAYEEGRSEPKIDTIIQMAQHFGISIDLLLTKEITINELYHIDKYAIGTNNLNDKQQENVVKDVKVNGIPLITSDKLLEYISGHVHKDFIANLPTIQLPQEKNRINRAFEVNSNEMFNLNSGIKVGDVVNGVFIGLDQPNLIYGKIYLIITNESILLRRLGTINKVLEFVADNPDFPIVKIGLEEIRELWEIKGVYRKDLVKSTTLESKIHELERIIHQLSSRVNKLENS